MSESEEILKKKIRELEEEVRVLQKDLIHDSLTGLKTRAFFEEEARVYFDVAVGRGQDYQKNRRKWFGFSNVSFVFFDVDKFKEVNDEYGHLAGDIVLKKIAEVIKKSVREGDTVARWGGDEMVATLVGATEEDAFSKAEEIRKAVEKIEFPELEDFRATLSIGVATAEAGKTFEEILKRADDALYKSKQEGRNKVRKYSDIG